jgi:hypothetical protein
VLSTGEYLLVLNGRTYHYRGQNAKFYDFVLDALTAFWHIKSEMKEIKREHL